jgi:hypothetical protein
MQLPFREKRHIDEASAGLLLRGETNISRHRKTNRAIKDATFETARPTSLEERTEFSTQQQTLTTMPTISSE